MNTDIKDGRLWYECGCNFEIIGQPHGKSKTPLIRFISDLHNPNHTINFNCPKTWELLGKGFTKGIFQLESPLGKQWCKKLKPENKEHIAALGAILRPGVLRAMDYHYFCNDCKTKFEYNEGEDSCPRCASDNLRKIGTSMTAHYCNRKNHEEPIKSYHPSIDPILFPSYNVMIYQEQSMRIAQAVAGFDLKEADMLRKAIGKKLPEEMAKVKLMFMEKAKAAKIISDHQAEEIFGWIEKSQRYAFNKCIRGNTIICKIAKNKYLDNNGYTVAHMYNIRNNISYAKLHGHLSLYKKWKLLGNYGFGLSLEEDGRIRKNIISDITYAGIRDIYRITLENNAIIDVTDNHKFPTPDGDKQTSDLIVGDVLYFKDEYEITDFKPINRFSNITLNKLREIASSKEHDRETIGFMSGHKNPGYTNGAYTEFVNNKKKLPTSCQKCGNDHCRLEVHHIDGDRSNNKIDNLINLCSSCHKIIEYANGRTKRGEKGYPHKLMKIKSIEYIGTDDVYDVEMDGPNHNFVVNEGIVTCNSHSTSYGETGYACAYAKVHNPLRFYQAWLEFAQNKQDTYTEIAELVNDARIVSNILILPPDIRFMMDHVHSDGKDIYFGLLDIKGVGQAQLNKLHEAVSDLDLSKCDWITFLTKVSDKISSTVMNALIKVGALDYFHIDRIHMMKEYEIWSGLTKKEQGCINKYLLDGNKPLDGMASYLRYVLVNKGYHNKNRHKIISDTITSLQLMPYKLEDTIDFLVHSEEELLGVALTCHITENMKNAMETHTCKEIVKGYKGYAVLKVNLDKVKIWKCKSGQNAGEDMAFVTMSDKTCAIDDAVMFPNNLATYRNIMSEGNILYVSGQLSDRGSFIIERVYEN